MTGTILLIILAAGIGIFHDTNKPTEYELSMEDGSNTYVVLQKNSGMPAHFIVKLTIFIMRLCVKIKTK